jgi:PAS domain S-box-containing protein
MVVLPIISLILTSYKSTWIWTGLSIATVGGFYFLADTLQLPDSLVAATTSHFVMMMNVGLILIMLWLTYMFEKQQRIFINKIENQREDLVAVDEELRQSLEELSATQDLLAEKEAESRSIVEALREHFFITEFDKEGNIIYANQRVIDMTRSAPVGLNRFEQMDGSMRDTRLKEWERIIEGESNSAESSYTVQGHTFWVMSTYAPIQNRLGKVSKILSVAHEITAAKKKEMEISEINEKLSNALDNIKKLNNKLEERVSERTIELEEKNKYLAEYAFINSHLLRAPLCRLMGLIQLLNYTDISKADSELLRYLLLAGEELDRVVGRINIAIEKGSYFDREIIRGNLKSI